MEGEIKRKALKRLCVFYRDAANYVGKPIEWIVCKQCQRKLRQGKLLTCNLCSFPHLTKKDLF